MQGMDWQPRGRMASLMGALKIEHPGTQNQRFTRAQFEQRLRTSFQTTG